MLFGQGKEWMKTGTGLFDLALESFDVLRSASLLEHLFLQLCRKKIPSSDIGLYRDDGLNWSSWEHAGYPG